MKSNCIFRILLLSLSIMFISDTSVTYAEVTEDDGYTLVFHDEFNQHDGSQPDSTKWKRSKRYWSTWNRWISDSRDVVYIKNGALVCRAIPNRAEKADTAAMLTGAVETMDRFSFTYGKVEVRMRTRNHKGNFPAVWMMPQPPALDHPMGGEIDIFECIDSENKAYHTVHSNWTINKGKRNSPISSFSEPVRVDRWHVYGFEWTEDKLIWTVDGKTAGVYEKSRNKEALDAGQWPFDKPFYLILNQSVGSGRWAAQPDTNYVYETRIDWIRVYQKR
jgi:beta-glucanase (GH16 family)